MLGYLTDENGEWTDTWGIIVRVSEKVDQSELSLEYRMPDCLRGVPVQIREWEAPTEMGPRGEDNPCGVDVLSLAKELSQREGWSDYDEDDLDGTVWRYIRSIAHKYRDRFTNHPHYIHPTGALAFRVAGKWIYDPRGIVVNVTKNVDQDALPSEDRIPECLDGVPVYLVVKEPFVLTMHELSEATMGYKRKYEAKYREEDMGND